MLLVLGPNMSILVPIDLTTPSRSAVALAVLIGRTLNVDVELFHVTVAPPSLDRLAALHVLAEPLRAASITTRLRTSQGTPSVAIPAQAERRSSSWIIMGTRGGVADSSPTDSVARAVMEAAKQPVVAIRPGPDGSPLISVNDDVLLVSAEDSSPASAIAAVLAAAVSRPVSRWKPHHGEGSALPVGARQRRSAPLVVAFDPRCAADQGWCARVLREEQSRAVVLVSASLCGCLA